MALTNKISGVETPAYNEEAIGQRVRDLRDAVRSARNAEADRDDSISSIELNTRERLRALQDELAEATAQLPEDDFFIMEISDGARPKLWIDPTAHVALAGDGQTYRFLKSTRRGQIVIKEDAGLTQIADAVVTYLGVRLVEAERIRESDWFQVAAAKVAEKAETTAAETPPDPAKRSHPLVRFFKTLIWMGLGALFTLIALMLYAYFAYAP